jgi:hypothetical protein
MSREPLQLILEYTGIQQQIGGRVVSEGLEFTLRSSYVGLRLLCEQPCMCMLMSG